MNNRVFDYLKLHSYGDRENFVLKYGVCCKAQELPKRYRRGAMRACFKNAALMSKRHDLIYVEGFASANKGHSPTLHAWCIDKCGSVYDRTWSFTGLNSYFGIPIKQSYLKKMYEATGAYGVLDQWEIGYPILTENPEFFICRNALMA